MGQQYFRVEVACAECGLLPTTYSRYTTTYSSSRCSSIGYQLSNTSYRLPVILLSERVSSTSHSAPHCWARVSSNESFGSSSHTISIRVEDFTRFPRVMYILRRASFYNLFLVLASDVATNYSGV